MAPLVCPWWLGYLLASPLRRLWQDPRRILAPLVRTGMTVLEPGPGMGFFTLELARLVGPAGRVVALDVQPRMLVALAHRAARAGLAERIETRLVRPDAGELADLAERVDFALLFAMVHEVPDQAAFLAGIARALKPGGRALLAEPTGHVEAPAFAATLEHAGAAGLRPCGPPPEIRSSRTALLEKRPPAP